MLTRVFKNGNSLAVRIPQAMAFAPEVKELRIERVGSTLVLHPVQGKTMADLGKVLARFGPGFMASGREALPEVERHWATGQSEAAEATPRKPAAQRKRSQAPAR
jgi:antitoxin VapB